MIFYTDIIFLVFEISNRKNIFGLKVLIHSVLHSLKIKLKKKQNLKTCFLTTLLCCKHSFTNSLTAATFHELNQL